MFCKTYPHLKSIGSFLVVLFLPILSFTQSKIQVTGVVTSFDGDPLIGVSVLVKDAGTGTTTDIDGKYSIETEADGTLIFSYLGYVQTDIEVQARTGIDVIMEEDIAQLGEVVVTALGIKRQKRELGYSTESFHGEELVLSNTPNVVSALSGKSAGVQVIAGNGVDGGTTRFVIRGNNNIDGKNQPLIVVDGIPLENEEGLTNIGRGVDWGSAINNINSNDIESMDILKGPTASALYGSRGANGVVLITTKKGRQSKGIGIEYNMTHKIIQPYYYRDVQNTFGAGYPLDLNEPDFVTDPDGNPVYPREIYRTNGPFGRPTTELFGYYSSAMSWGPRMEGQMIEWWDGEMRPFSPQPDNLKLFFSNGSTTIHNLSFSGGGKMGTMRASITRQEHSAVVPNSSYDQTTVNLGSQLNISSKVKANIALSYINYHRLNSPTLGDNNETSFGKGILYSWPRSYKGLEKDINILPDGTRNNYQFEGGYPFVFSPPHLWWNTYNNNTNFDRNKLIGAVSLTYDVLPWLNITGRVGTDFTLNQFERRNNPIDFTGINGGFYSNELGRDIVLNNDFLITAHKEGFIHNQIKASVSFGGNQYSRDQYGLRGSSGQWANPWLFTFNNFEDRLTVGLPSEFRFEKRINSLYGFFNLSYGDFLFLETTGRNDWSSTLPIDNNSYFYPSVSLSFIPTKAFDLSKYDWLSFWKVRGAFAQTGTDAENPYLIDFVYSTGSFGGSQTAALPGTIPPIALRPQRANSYEMGTTIGLFNDKINLDLTYYYIRSFDQILNSPIPTSGGAGQVRINTGELENRGIEAILDITLIKNSEFYWKTGFNFARNRNNVISLGEGADILEIANIWGLNGPAISVRAGEDYGTIVGWDYIYHEDSGQPILNEDGTHYLITENRVPIGNAYPDFTGGWTMQLGYKGFVLSTLVDTKWGGDLYAGSYVIGLQTGQSKETLPERLGEGLPYTHPDGTTSNSGVILPGVYADGTPNDKVVHYYFKHIGNTGGWGRFNSKPGIIENTWVKLRELSLRYEFSDKLARKTKIFQKLSLNITGRDLFYLYTTLPDNINPEGANGSGNAQGLEWAAFPGARSISFGLNASF